MFKKLSVKAKDLLKRSLSKRKKKGRSKSLEKCKRRLRTDSQRLTLSELRGHLRRVRERLGIRSERSSKSVKNRCKTWKSLGKFNFKIRRCGWQSRQSRVERSF